MKQLMEYINADHLMIVDKTIPKELYEKLQAEVNKGEDCWIIVWSDVIGTSVLLDLYNTYEFTDKITYLSDRRTYPTIVNYWKQGIITMEELVEALLNE